MNRDDFLKRAIEFKTLGISIVPLAGWNSEKVDEKYRGKRPLVDWTPYQTRVATDKEIMEWSTLDTELNIGVVCGKISNLTIIDIDGEEGMQSLTTLNLPETYRVNTGKGVHYYFQYCNNPAVNNAVRILPGIDVRTEGGYVVSAYSKHKTGAVYTAHDPLLPVLPFPEHIMHIFEEKAAKKATETERFDPTKLVEGSRNSTLASISGSLFKVLADRDLVLENIKVINSKSPDPLDDKEVETIVNSICRYNIDAPKRKTTDIGVAERFMDVYKDTICFNVDSGNWMIFDGKRWVAHATDKRTYMCKEIVDKTIALIRNIPNEQPEDSEFRESYEKFAHQCESAGHFKAIIGLLSQNMGRSGKVFDADSTLFNCANVTFDLKSKNYKAHDRVDMLTKISPVIYNKEADCPIWKSFLDHIFNGNASLIKYMQRAVGYTMTGDTSEQVFFTLYGSGANGKSVFLDTLRYIMGDYGQQAEFSTFLAKQDNGARNDIARMVGARFVAASESGVFKTIDDALIKDITGGKQITARFLYKEPFEFTPQMKIFLATNHKPNIHDDSNGMWRRVKLIPFTVVIPKAEQDKNLYYKLLSEASGILNWCLEGYKMWAEAGLGNCSAVEEATEEYQENMDVIGRFVSENLVVGDTKQIKSSLLYDTFVEWCKRNGETAWKHTTFSLKMADKGYKKVKKSDSNYWLGIDNKSEF